MVLDSLKWIDAVEFDRLQRGRFTSNKVKFDGSDDETSWRRWVEQIAIELTREFEVRMCLSKSDPLYVAPLMWLKPIAYNAILSCLRYDYVDLLGTRAQRFSKLQRGPKSERTIFMVGLVGLFGHALPIYGRTNRPVLDEKTRMRMANEMWWAFRHYVTPDELVAFNRAHPLHRATPRPDQAYVVPALFEQIVERRASALSDDRFSWIEDIRGAYPAIIESAVKAEQDAAHARHEANRKRKR